MLARKYDDHDYDYKPNINRTTRDKPNTALKTVSSRPRVFKTSRINFVERRKIIFMATVFIFLMFATLVRNQYLMETGTELVKSQRIEAEQSKANELLKVEVAQLGSPERITNIASSKLGMVVVKQNYYLQGSDEGKTGKTEGYWEKAKEWLGF